MAVVLAVVLVSLSACVMPKTSRKDLGYTPSHPTKKGDRVERKAVPDQCLDQALGTSCRSRGRPSFRSYAGQVGGGNKGEPVVRESVRGLGRSGRVLARRGGATGEGGLNDSAARGAVGRGRGDYYDYPSDGEEWVNGHRQKPENKATEDLITMFQSWKGLNHTESEEVAQRDLAKQDSHDGQSGDGFYYPENMVPPHARQTSDCPLPPLMKQDAYRFKGISDYTDYDMWMNETDAREEFGPPLDRYNQELRRGDYVAHENLGQGGSYDKFIIQRLGVLNSYDDWRPTWMAETQTGRVACQNLTKMDQERLKREFELQYNVSSDSGESEITPFTRRTPKQELGHRLGLEVGDIVDSEEEELDEAAMRENYYDSKCDANMGKIYDHKAQNGGWTSESGEMDPEERMRIEAWSRHRNEKREKEVEEFILMKLKDVRPANKQEQQRGSGLVTPPTPQKEGEGFRMGN